VLVATWWREGCPVATVWTWSKRGPGIVGSIAITKRNVDAADPGRRYDTRLPGFGLYVSPDGATRSYFVEYRPRGLGRASGKKRLTFARHGGPRPDGSSWTADLARDEALKLLGAIRAGADSLAERAQAKTRAEAAAFLIDEGIKTQGALFERVEQKLGEIERLRAELRGMIAENKT